MHYKRKLSSKFIADLKSGLLAAVLTRVQEDETLMLAIRDDYVNIYYRGGNLLKISRSYVGNSYSADFDEKYFLTAPSGSLSFPLPLDSVDSVTSLIDAIPRLKYAMDKYFSRLNKAEREFQQLVVRENNCSPVSNETDYFIVDIEIAGILPNAKYDMLAVRWLSHEHGKPGTLVPVLIEMKYGIHALGGKSGLKKHIDDAYSLRADDVTWNSVILGMEEQLNQLDELGLLTFSRSIRVPRLELNREARPELIFLLANYNPASIQLIRFLEELEADETHKEGFDLLFFASCFSGYGMHRESMLSLKEFRAEVKRLHGLAKQKKDALQVSAVA